MERPALCNLENVGKDIGYGIIVMSYFILYFILTGAAASGKWINDRRCLMKRFISLLLTMLTVPGCLHFTYAAEQPAAEPEHIYQLVIADCTWTQAFQNAKNAGGHLACFETQEEYHAVLNQILNENHSDIMFLIGGRRDPNGTEYRWDYGDNVLQGEVLNSPSSWAAGQWMKGEPSFGDAGTAECFMEMYFYSGENRWVFNDVPDDIIAVVPGYSGKIGYIVEYDDVGTGQGPTLVTEGSGQGPAPENANTVPSWQSAYESFVMNQEYLNDPEKSFGDYSTHDLDLVSCALRDMNADGTPELIIFNGDASYAGSLSYLYQYVNGAVSYVGTMSCSYGPDYDYVDNPSVPGLFTTGSHMGAIWTYYYSFDGSLVEETVSWKSSETQNPDTGLYEQNYDPNTGEPIYVETSRTENESVYHAYQTIENGSGNKLSFFTQNELESGGWDIFISEYGYSPAAPAEAASPAPASASLPAEFLAALPLDFYWSSGAGNMDEYMQIFADGTFEAKGSDTTMNPPQRVEYSITGNLSDFTQADDYTWTANITSISYVQEPGTTYTDGELSCQVIEAYQAVGDTLYLYLPGHPFDTLPEIFRNQLYMYMSNENKPNITGFGLYNDTHTQSYWATSY